MKKPKLKTKTEPSFWYYYRKGREIIFGLGAFLLAWIVIWIGITAFFCILKSVLDSGSYEDLAIGMIPISFLLTYLLESGGDEP